jgi:hypothetical protein
MRRGRSSSCLTANERRAIKLVFEKQIVTLTYVKSIKDPAKKVETACLLIVDAFKTRKGL